MDKRMNEQPSESFIVVIIDIIILHDGHNMQRLLYLSLFYDYEGIKIHNSTFYALARYYQTQKKIKEGRKERKSKAITWR